MKGAVDPTVAKNVKFFSIFFVRPAKWKKHFELINSSKDASRTKAIEMYPSISQQLSKKKDVNKSDAILIARYYSETRFKEDK